MRFVAPCLLGLEGLAANDLKFTGIPGLSIKKVIHYEIKNGYIR